MSERYKVLPATPGLVRKLEAKLRATELERDDFHRELMDLRYQLELAKA